METMLREPRWAITSPNARIGEVYLEDGGQLAGQKTAEDTAGAKGHAESSDWVLETKTRRPPCCLLAVPAIRAHHFDSPGKRVGLYAGAHPVGFIDVRKN